ncbi:MAG TPA: DUF4199 domain-containing protein [Bacteroidales bacterium]|jgi:hypothetical protein|nr:DUF4199 domain-containing protein [Bacteroidales bacterium]
MNSSFWNKAAINGLLLAFVSIVMMVIQTVFDMGKAMDIILWIVKLAGTVGLLYYFMREFGKQCETYTYSDAFKFGLAVSFFSSIIASCYYFVHVAFLFPDVNTQMSNAILMGLEQTVATSEMNTDKLIANLPLIVCISQFFYMNILGLLWSSILGSSTKHKEPATPFDR